MDQWRSPGGDDILHQMGNAVTQTPHLVSTTTQGQSAIDQGLITGENLFPSIIREQNAETNAIRLPQFFRADSFSNLVTRLGLDELADQCS